MKGKRGGVRAGAGRPAYCDDVVQVSLRITSLAKERIKILSSEMDISIASLIDKMLECFEDHKEECDIK